MCEQTIQSHGSRKSLFLSIGTFIASTLAFFPCEVSARDLTATEADNGKSFNLAIDDTLNVTLEGNPTTGFTWEVTSENPAVVHKVAQSYTSSSNLTGAGGTFTFTFRAASEGSSNLHFVYARPWEKNTEPAKTFDLTISVDAPSTH